MAGRAVSGMEYLAALAGGVPPAAKPDGASAANATNVAAKGAQPARLDELGEGQLGELVVRRSGAVSLHIGDFKLDVQPGTTCSIEQEVVAMAMPPAPGEKIDLHRLGKLQERVVVTPDLDDLLSGTMGGIGPLTGMRAVQREAPH